MKTETTNCMNEMIDYALRGNEVYPMFFQRSYGRATVSSAVRCAKQRKQLVVGGLDGVGNPFYIANPDWTGKTTHKVTLKVQ